MKATRQVPGEVILADYGDQYWRLGARQTHTYVIFRMPCVVSLDPVEVHVSAALRCDAAFRLARHGKLSTPHYFDGRRRLGKLPWTGAR